MGLSLVLGLGVGQPANGVRRAVGLVLDFALQRYASDGPFRSTLPAGFTFSRAGAGTALRD